MTRIGLTRYAARLFCAAALFLSGCSSDKASSEEAAAIESAAGGATVPMEIVNEPVEHVLTDWLPAAQTCVQWNEFKFERRPQAKWLSAGWNGFNGVESGGTWFGETGLIEVVLARPEEMTLTTVLKPAEFEAAVEQSVNFFWNDQFLQSFPIKREGTQVRVKIPAELQRYGTNRLRMDPGYWINSYEVSYRPYAGRSLRCGPIRFERKSPMLDQNRAPVQAKGQDIVQPADSSAVFHLRLPQNPVLVLKGRLEGGSPKARGEAVVAATLSDGKQKILLRQSLQENRVFEARQELKELSGQYVSLSLSFPCAISGEARPTSDTLPRLRWMKPVLQCEEPHLAPVDFSPVRSGYNVVVVLFDSLRADFTTVYGDKTTKTPGMQSLAESGVTFDQARSNISWTRPSSASILSSLRPAVHKVGHGNESVPQTMAMLPQILKNCGYRTLSVVNNAQVSKEFGFERGFDKIEEIFRNRPVEKDPGTLARNVWDKHVQPFLDVEAHKPFFLYLHEIDPHSPYTPPGAL